MSCDT